MTRKLLILLFFLVQLLPWAQSLPTGNTCQVTPHFSPVESVQAAVINELAKAHESVYISAYGISSPDIADVLIKQRQNGIDVRVLTDYLQAMGAHSQLGRMKSAGIAIVIKPSRVLEHNKYIIIDRKTVVMGSWNFSISADKQDNSDVVIMNCPDVIEKFYKDWLRIQKRDSGNG